MTEIEDGTEDDYDLETFKTVLIGDSSVGKTSIIKSFTLGFFEDNQPSTSSANYTSKALYYSPYEKGCSFQIWDTCGQEKYRSLNHIFYKDATIAVLVYDITQKKTYESIVEYWYDEVKQKAPEDILIVLCANKSDLLEEEQVEQQVAQKWANEHKVPFFPTSAKNLTGIKEMFIDLGQAKLNMMFDFSEINKRLEMEMQNDREDSEEEEEQQEDKKYETIKQKENDAVADDEDEDGERRKRHVKEAEKQKEKEKEDVKEDIEVVKEKEKKTKKEANVKEENNEEGNNNKENNGTNSSGKKKKKKTQNSKQTANSTGNGDNKGGKKKPLKKKSNAKTTNKKGIKLGEDEPVEKDGEYSRSKCC